MRNYSIEQRANKLAHYIVDSKDTVRGAAKKFGISKSTVHMEVTIQNGLRKDNSNIEKLDREINKCISAQQNKGFRKYEDTDNLGE